MHLKWHEGIFPDAKGSSGKLAQARTNVLILITTH